MTDFIPFAQLSDGPEVGDFHLNEMAEPLALTNVQRVLLGYLLRDIDIKVWFDDDKGDDLEKADNRKPTIELLAFFQMNFVSKVDLIDLLEEMFEMDLTDPMIDLAETVAVLERLHKVVDHAIKAREAHP